MLVAAAAARCHAHFTALVYVEMWAEEQGSTHEALKRLPVQVERAGMGGM